jgi:hypothetical protein
LKRSVLADASGGARLKNRQHAPVQVSYPNQTPYLPSASCPCQRRLAFPASAAWLHAAGRSMTFPVAPGQSHARRGQPVKTALQQPPPAADVLDARLGDTHNSNGLCQRRSGAHIPGTAAPGPTTPAPCCTPCSSATAASSPPRGTRCSCGGAHKLELKQQIHYGDEQHGSADAWVVCSHTLVSMTSPAFPTKLQPEWRQLRMQELAPPSQKACSTRPSQQLSFCMTIHQPNSRHSHPPGWPSHDASANSHFQQGLPSMAQRLPGII